MKAEIVPIFVDIVYKINLQEFNAHNKELEKIATKLYRNNKKTFKTNWACNTFSTIGKINLNDDTHFKQILNRIYKEVSIFANEFGALYNQIQCIESWLNLAKPGAFQEIHIHPMSHFSSVYYVKVPENSGEIIFQSHGCSTDMFDFVTNGEKLPSYRRYSFTPKECDLLIFRSNMLHMVNSNNSKQNRISISSNFVLHNI